MSSIARSSVVLCAFFSVLAACGDDEEKGTDAGSRNRDGGEIRRDSGTDSGTGSDRADGGAPRTKTKLSGVVVDTRGTRLEGARIELGDSAAMSNLDGEFLLESLNPSSDAHLTVSLNGYSTGRIPLAIMSDTPNHVRVTLQPAQMAMLMSPQQGGEVKTESGGAIMLPAAAIVDADGNAVTGPVEIAFAVVNDRDEMSAAPGGMMAIDPMASADAPAAQLESFGMMQVSMSANGEPVKLKEGATAAVQFPLAPHHPFSLGEQVELWSFGDDETVWKSEGFGTVIEGNKLEAQVGHFSWWNADQVLTKTCVVGRVLDTNGKPVAAAQINAEGRSYLGSSHATADRDGQFCLEARISSTIEVSTLVRVGDADQALAVQVNTPRTKATCGAPSDCFVLPQNLVAIAVSQANACIPDQCPTDPSGKERCCLSDIGPCSFVVNGDCGGKDNGAWEPEPENPGVMQVPGVPMATDPGMGGAGGASGAGAGGAGAGGVGGAGTGAGGAAGGGDSGGAGASGAGAGGAGVGGAGAGGAGSGAAGGGATGLACGGVQCTLSADVRDFYPNTTLCCTADNKCGQTTPAGACLPQNVPGSPAAQCDDATVATSAGESFVAGCCAASDSCGLNYGPIGWGCVDNQHLGQGMGGPRAVVACAYNSGDAGGDDNDGGTAVGGTGGKPGGGSSGRGGSGGAGGGMADGGTAGKAGSPAAGSGGSGGNPSGGRGGFGGSGGSGGGPGGTKLDRCPDAVALANADMTVEGTTADSLLQNDWWDRGSCYSYLPGPERVYSVSVPAGKTLRVAVDQPGMRAVLSADCADVLNTCTSDDEDASFTNYDSQPRPVIITVDSEAEGPGAGFTLTLSTAAAACGDGIRDRSGQHYESCDDGNTQNGDGCSADCNLEGGPFRCPDSGGACVEVSCGDGHVDHRYGASYESCDDGNTNPGDGCSATCQREAGYYCDGSDPTQCSTAVAGDVCSNALSLMTGTNQYNLSGYRQAARYMGDKYNDDCDEPCRGADAWFVRTLAPHERLDVGVSASFSQGYGYAYLYGAGPNGCSELLSNRLSDAFFGFGSGSTQMLAYENDSFEPVTIYLIVASEAEQDTSSFSVSAMTSVPPSSCGGQPCVCGDEQRSQNEECDDGNLEDGDGCSASCSVETGFACAGAPSACAPALPGDSCTSPEPLASSDAYTLAGYTPDPSCDYSCTHSRWFSVTVPGGSTLEMMFASTQMNGLVQVYKLSESRPCEGMGYGSEQMFTFYVNQPSSPYRWFNDEPKPASLLISVAEYYSNAATPVFSLQAAIKPVGCGDGYVDRYHNYGSAEECDDGGNTSGDGCSPTCTTEAGWDCSDGNACREIICGDGFTNGNEQCDDGDTTPQDGCSDTCTIEQGWLCDDHNPSTCQAYQPGGDICEEAEVLVDGTFSLAGFLPDLSCKNVCEGPDRWFQITVPAGQTARLRGTTADLDARIAVYEAQDGCNSHGGDERPLRPDAPYEQFYVNDSPNAKVLRIAVFVWDEPNGSFTLDHQLKATGCGDGYWDRWGELKDEEGCDDGNTNEGDGCSSTCQPEPGYQCDQNGCIAIVCGDGNVSADEACDDGNNMSDDGCSGSCQIEPGYLCNRPQQIQDGPSQCLEYKSDGDLCENAIPLEDSSYSLDGYAPDWPCNAICRSNDRWFTVTVPAHQTLLVHASSSNLQQGLLYFFDLSTSTCDEPQSIDDTYFFNGETGTLAWVNSYNDPWTIGVAVAAWNPVESGTTFDISHSIRQAGCGDGYRDYSGEFGPKEDCDDGNVVNNDGCSSTCTYQK